MARLKSSPTRITVLPTLPPSVPGGASWVPAAGYLTEVTTKNSYLDIAPPPGPYYVGTANEWYKTITDYSGGVLANTIGSLGGMLLHGGGHSATNINAVSFLDFNDLTYKRLTDPSTATAPDQGSLNPLGFDSNNCEYSDGQPGAAHTYDALAYLPPSILMPSLPSARYGWLVRPWSGAVGMKFSANTGWAHALAINSLTDRSLNLWYRASLNGMTSVIAPGGASAYDSNRKFIWWRASASGFSPIRYFDTQSRMQISISLDNSKDCPTSPDSLSMRYLPAPYDLLIASGTRGNAGLGIYYLSCANPSAGWTSIPLSSTIPALADWQHPFDYVPEINKLILLSPADKNAVYEISLPATLGQAWAVQRRPFLGLNNIPTEYVVGKRWSYNSALKCFPFLIRPGVPAVNKIFAYRPVGT